jgi:hypothetical protein
MTTPISSPEIQLAQLFKQRLDFFESRISTLEFQSRQQTIDTEFSQQFEILIAQMRTLTAAEPPTP